MSDPVVYPAHGPRAIERFAVITGMDDRHRMDEARGVRHVAVETKADIVTRMRPRGPRRAPARAPRRARRNSRLVSGRCGHAVASTFSVAGATPTLKNRGRQTGVDAASRFKPSKE